MRHHQALLVLALTAGLQTTAQRSVSAAQVPVSVQTAPASSNSLPGPSPSVRPRSETEISAIPLFLGAPGGTGEVRAYDETTGVQLEARPELANIQLLPIDCVGRTEVDRFLPDRPRHRADVPGASRLCLPGAFGNLYRFRRSESSGASIFGFLRITDAGRMSVLGERIGTGANQDADPYVGRIAVAPSGGTILVATSPVAGGNLLEIELGSGLVIDRTSQLAPLVLLDAGLWLNASWGFGVATTGIFRFQRQAQSMAELVGVAGEPQPAWFSGQAVVSRNREWALTSAGAHRTSLSAFVFGRLGDAQRISQAPTELSGAGFLPESQDGPYMAVSDDGLCAAWARRTISREVVLARQPQAPQGAAQLEVTADQFFIDTLDEVGILSFLTPDELMFGIGEASMEGGLERTDFFRVTLSAQANAEFTNLSLSSGDAEAPFLSVPLIDPDTQHWLPESQSLLLLDLRNEDLLRIDPHQPGAQVLLSQVDSIEFVERVGDSLLVALRRSFDPMPYELYRIESTFFSEVSLLHAGGPETSYLNPAPRGDGWIGFVLTDVVNGDSMARMNVAAGTLELSPGGSGTFVSPIAFSPLGSQLFVSDTGNGFSFQIWTDGVERRLPLRAAGGHFLPH